jgi:hypothetical protein
MGQARIKDSTLATFLDISHANTVGTPIATSALTYTGEAFGGRYTIAFSSVTPGTSATATLTTESSLHPRSGFSKTVALDGTAETELIPGASLTFSNSGSFTNSWTGYVDLGDYAGVINAGTGAGTETKLAVVNTGTTVLSSCAIVVARPKVKLYRKTGTGPNDGLESIKAYTTGATEYAPAGVTTRYVVSFANLNTAPTPDTIDVLVDGVLITTVQSVDEAGAPTSNSAGLRRDGSSRYRVLSGGLTGTEFVIGSAAANAHVSNVTVWDSRHVQIAPDNSGSPGTWGTSNVTLTQSGKPAGEIHVAGAAYFWWRPNVASGASSQKNPHPLDFYVVFSDTGAANITG